MRLLSTAAIEISKANARGQSQPRSGELRDVTTQLTLTRLTKDFIMGAPLVRRRNKLCCKIRSTNL
jgi:hypothetical protein